MRKAIKRAAALILAAVMTIASTSFFDSRSGIEEIGNILSFYARAAEDEAVQREYERLADENNAEFEEASSDEEFFKILSDLTSETWEDSFFGEIVVDSRENTVYVDGTQTNQEVCDIIEEGLLPSSESDESPVSRFSPEKVTRLGCEVEETNGVFRVTRPYQTKRLVLRTKDGSLSSFFGAQKVISDSEGRYILQYDSEETAKYAYGEIEKDENTASVTVDSVMTVTDVRSSRSSSALTENGRNRWGAERTESYRYIKYLSENGKTDEIVVAVVDTGVDKGHPFLEGRVLSGGYNTVDRNSRTADDNMHGTHCSGIIADNTPDSVKILPVKCLNSNGSGTNTMVAAGIEYAAQHGADVISLSLGCRCGNEKCEVSLAAKKAIENGTVCVVASGNDGDDAAKYCPSCLDECITVSALSQDDSIALFSNYGKAVDIAAPGVSIWSSVPVSYDTSMYASASGTSMAAPFVSAAAALILTNNPSLTPREVENELKKASVDLGVKGKDAVYGFGALDFGVLLGDSVKASSISSGRDSISLYTSGNVEFAPERMNISVLPFDATDKSYSVSIADETVASFTEYGFKGLKTGETTAIFSLDNGQKTTCKIKVEKRTFWIDYAAKSYGGGSGTSSDPYLISTAEQLAKISYDSNYNRLPENVCFKQTADIDLDGRTWYPIIPGRDCWRINYDGDGYKINNLSIEEIDTGVFFYYAGLFAENSGEIQNVNVIDAKIDCPDTSEIGIICGDFGGYMHNCFTSGRISGTYMTGGVVGSLDTISRENATIINCRSDADIYVSDPDSWNGGIAGDISDGQIKGCVFGGKITDNTDSQYTGGIAGVITCMGSMCTSTDIPVENSIISDCVSAENIVGTIQRETLSNGEVLYPEIRNSYYSGNFDSPFKANQYTDKTVTEKLERVSGAEMRTPAFYNEKSRWSSKKSWDTEKTWTVKSDYPFLKAQHGKKNSTEYDYFEFDDYIELTGYRGSGSYLVIPAYIDSKPVRVISTKFYLPNARLKSLCLPDTVRTVGDLAFDGSLTGLEYLDLGNGLEKIAYRAFYAAASLRYAEMPASVKTLDPEAFYLSSLRYVFFNGNPGNFSRDAFVTGLLTKARTYYPDGNTEWKKNNPVGASAHKPQEAIAVFSHSGNIRMKKGDKENIHYTVFPETAYNSAHTVTSSNEKAVKVGADSGITAAGYGTASIEIKYGRLKESFSVEVTDSKTYPNRSYEVKKATTGANGAKKTYCSVCGELIGEKTVYKPSAFALSETDIVYDGKVKSPSVTVKNSKGTILSSGGDYTVSYSSGRKNIGEYSVKVMFKGDYSGEKTLKFRIVPSAVSSLKASQTTTSVKLTWKKVSSVSGYVVYKYDSGTKKYTKIKTLTADKTSYTIKKLRAGTKYTYAVRAYKTVGKTNLYSPYKKLTTATKTKTPVISSVTAGSKKATLKWKSVTGATGYQVYMATSKDGAYKKVTATKKLSATVKSLKTGKTCYFRIRTYKTVGDLKIYSAFSDVKKVKIK